MPQKPDLAKRELWRKRLQDFERQNTTIVEFCRRVGAPVWSFYYWRQRLQPATITAASHRQRHRTATPTRHHRARHAGTKPSLNFVPIQITGQPSVEVHLPNGARLTVPSHDRDAIAAVIAALLSQSPEARTC
jgi:hypothetical protein